MTRLCRKSVLRTRARTVTELAQLTQRSEDQLRHDLAKLERLGYLTVADDTIVPSDAPPAPRLLEHATDTLRDVDSRLRRDLDALYGTLAWLPRLLHHATTPDDDGRALPIEIAHGPNAAEDIWHRLAARGSPTTADAVMPDVRRLYAPHPEPSRPLRTLMTGERRARAILSVDDATHPAVQDRIAANLAGGVQLRMHPDLPGWFWVNEDATVGLPLAWGEGWPTSVMAITHPAIAGLARHVFNRLWEQAQPLRTEPLGWEPLLRLMQAGASTETASRALGISARTGGRRIAEAMEHYGTRTLFGLGAAWSTERGADGSGADQPA